MLVVVVADVVPVAASVLIVALVLRNWQEVPDKIENLPHKLAHDRLIDEEALSLLHNLGPKQELTRKWNLINCIWYILSLSILCRNRTQSSQRSLFIASRTHAHINIQIHTVFFPSNNTKCIKCKPKGKEGPTPIFSLLQPDLLWLHSFFSSQSSIFRYQPFENWRIYPLITPKTPSEVVYYVKSIFSRGGMLCSITRRFYLLIEENHLNPAIAESLLIPFTAKDVGPLTRSSPHLSQLHLLLQPGLLWLRSFFSSQSSFFRYQPLIFKEETPHGMNMT